MLLAAACAPPVVIKRVDVAYPDGVQREPNGATIDAKVRVYLTGDGHVASVAIAHTSGIAQFDQSAMSGVKQWQFIAPSNGCADDPINVIDVQFDHTPAFQDSYDPCAHPPIVLNQVVPEYPPEARDMGLGRVTVAILVDVDAAGNPGRIQLLRSSGNMAVDYAARVAASKSVYAPRYAQCKPVPGQYRFVVTFQ